MTSFMNKIISEICKEEGIKETSISKNWITVLEKDGKVRYINGSRFGLNSQMTGLIADDKYAFYEAAKEQGIPTIDTTMIWDRNLAKRDLRPAIRDVKEYFNTHNKNIVLKPNTGYMGNNVYRITDGRQIRPAMQLLTYKYDTLICQPFIALQNEYRFIMLNGECRLAYKKVRTDESDWKFNLSKGARTEKIDSLALFEVLNNLAKKVCDRMNFKFVSVDIAETFDNNFFIIEVNSGVATSHYAEYNPEDYGHIKQIYKDAILELFKE